MSRREDGAQSLTDAEDESWNWCSLAFGVLSVGVT